jgi:hypothetical protein
LSLTLRAKFLLLSALIQALVVGLLIWNSLRLMNNAVSANAERVAQEYAVALNLALSPYATAAVCRNCMAIWPKCWPIRPTVICAIWSSSININAHPVRQPPAGCRKRCVWAAAPAFRRTYGTRGQACMHAPAAAGR